jgi:hypothetical protein
MKKLTKKQKREIIERAAELVAEINICSCIAISRAASAITGRKYNLNHPVRLEYADFYGMDSGDHWFDDDLMYDSATRQQRLTLLATFLEIGLA